MRRRTRSTRAAGLILLAGCCFSPAYGVEINTHCGLTELAALRLDSIADETLRGSYGFELGLQTGSTYNPRRLLGIPIPPPPISNPEQVSLPTCGMDEVRPFRAGDDRTVTRTATLLDWLKIGVVAEDADYTILPGIGRYWHHFHEPLTEIGLTTIAGELPGFSLVPIEGKDSVQWAWSNGGLLPQADLRASLESDDWSWQRARHAQWYMLTSPRAEDREMAAGIALRALGHVVHLLQDAASPQHARNDAHSPLEVSVPGVRGSAFEDYCSRDFGTLEQLRDFQEKEPLPSFDLTATQESLWLPDKAFKAFWDTDQYSGQPGWEPIQSAGLSEFSNAFMVTNDTLFPESDMVTVGDRKLTLDTPIVGGLDTSFFRIKFPNPSLSRTDLGAVPGLPAETIVLRAGEVEGEVEALPIHARVEGREYRLCSISSSPQLTGSRYGLALLLTDKDRHEHATMLLRKAISYSTGLMNYFFRGRMSVAVEPMTRDERRRTGFNARVTVTNRSSDPMHEIAPGFIGTTARFQIYGDLVDDRTGEQSRWPVRTGSSDWQPSSRPLNPGESFTFNAELLPKTRYIAVFRGSLGTEPSIAVSAQTFEAPGIVTVDSIELKSDQVKGGAEVAGVIKLTAPAPEGGLDIVVNASSTVVALRMTSPVPEGASEVPFTATFAKVTKEVTAELTASDGFGKKSVEVKVVPAE